jgi:hypothetical protein
MSLPPLAASVETAILADQWDFFLFLLFILVKHATSSLCIITAFGVNLGSGVHWDIVKDRYRRTNVLIQTR